MEVAAVPNRFSFGLGLTHVGARRFPRDFHGR